MTHETRKKVMAAALWIGGLAAFAVLASQTLAFDAAALLPIVTDSAWTPSRLAPVAWYEADGDTMDSSGNVNNGTGSPGYVAGVVAQAFNSTGTVTIADAASMRPGTNDFTVAFWRKEPDANAAYVMASKRLSSGTFNQLSIVHGTPLSNGSVSSTKRLGILMVENGLAAWTAAYSSSDVWNGNFRHCAFVRSGTNLTLYVDGVASALTYVVGAGVLRNISNSEPWTINTATSAGSATDDFLYFGRALTTNEVSTLYSESVKQSAKGVAW